MGQGSLFWFDVDLPIALDWAETGRTVKQGMVIGYQGRKQKILVVDDKWENRSVLVSLLEPIGFEIAEASNGKEGLDKAVEIQPDAIITDLVMPVMDGSEMISHLRQSRQFKDVVIVASSASVFETDQYKSLNAGANAFLPKPVQAESLLELLQRYLGMEWVYKEQDSVEMQAEEIIPPPADILRHLHTLIKQGDIYAILDEANQIKQAEPAIAPFAQKLIQLAENFQLKLLEAFINNYL